MTGWALGVDLGSAYTTAAVASSDRVELLDVGGAPRQPSAPVAAALSRVVDAARARFGGEPPTALVLTHPGGRAADALREAAERVLPGCALRLLPEPVAVAAHHARVHGLADGERVAVHDLGGGSFNAAVVARDGSGFRLLGSPARITDTGGAAFDALLYAQVGHRMAQLCPEWWGQAGTSAERRWQAARAELAAEVRRARHALSVAEQYSVFVAEPDVEVVLQRADLERDIGADVARTVEVLDRVVADAGGADRLAAVSVVGGASRTPLVERALRAAHGDRLRLWPDPQAVVALGAAGTVALDTAGGRDAPLEPMRAWNAPGPVRELGAAALGMAKGAAAAGGAMAKDAASAAGARASAAFSEAQQVRNRPPDGQGDGQERAPSVWRSPKGIGLIVVAVLTVIAIVSGLTLLALPAFLATVVLLVLVLRSPDRQAGGGAP